MQVPRAKRVNLSVHPSNRRRILYGTLPVRFSDEEREKEAERSRETNPLSVSLSTDLYIMMSDETEERSSAPILER